jgi:hypothetical protein
MNNISSFSSLRELGFSVFPLQARSKKPVGSWKEYQTTSANAGECAAWETAYRYNPYNIGIATGSVSGCFVLDVDGEQGRETLAKLIAEHGELPATPTVKTGKGQHYYFRYPAGYTVRNLAGRSVHGEILPGIDHRGDGGYVVAPPSIHPDGMAYEWIVSPWQTTLADAPAWLLELVAVPENNETLDFNGAADNIPAGAYLEKALANELTLLTQAPAGQRNDRLNRASFSLGQLIAAGLDEDMVRRELHAAARMAGLEDVEITPTIDSGIAAGKQKPRDIPANADSANSANANANRISGISNASISEWQTPTPLTQEIAAQEPYPVEALPDVIREAVASYQAYGQQPVPIVAIAGLANVSLACQGLADIARDEVLTGPISLNFIVTADSGERKTSADKVFSKAAREWEKAKRAAMQAELKQAKILVDAYLATRAGITQQITSASKNGGTADQLGALQAALQQIDTEAPQLPVIPTLLFEDVTQEALIDELARGHPSAALYSDEAAIVIGSHGFHQERCLRYFGLINRLWDGNGYKRQRITSESTSFYGRRMTCSLMMQLSVLKTLISVADGQSRNTGFLARVLIACPDSTMGTRFYKEPQSLDRALDAFHARIHALLEMPLPVDKETGELTPPLLGLSNEAHQMWVEYYNETELAIGARGEFYSVRDFAAKSAENAARLACNFHIFQQGATGEVDSDAMQRAITIMQWHLRETLRVFSHIDTPEEMTHARLLLEWLKRKNHRTITASEIATHGPNQLRQREARHAALKTLCEHGYLRERAVGRNRQYEVNPSLAEVTP